MNKYALPDWIPEYLEDKSWTIKEWKEFKIEKHVCGWCNGLGYHIIYGEME